MHYTLQDKQTFEKQLDDYLISNPTHLIYERNKINNFSSNNLSDLYKLFSDLEDHELDEELFAKLKEIISNCSVDPNQILLSNTGIHGEYIISQPDVSRLVDTIKDTVLNYIDDPETIIDKEEFTKLYTIVSKLLPKTQSKLKQFTKSENFKKTVMETLETWKKHNTKSDNNTLDAQAINRDILSAIFIATNEMYPELDIYLPARIKSPNSTVNNIIKETYKSFFSIIPSDPSQGISNTDIEKQFNLDKAKNDFSGFTFVLSNIDDTLHFDKSNPENIELIRLRKKRGHDIKFYHNMEDFLNEHDMDSTSLSNIQLLQIKIDLLKRLRTLTYEECTKEYNGTSFTQLLDEAIATYKNISSDPEIFYEDDIYEKKIAEIYRLLDEFKNRVHDKYQAKILEIILPDILNCSLLTQDLGVKCNFIKSVKKENGFCADYYELESPDNRKIELQAITKYRSKESKSGFSSHNKLSGKSIDIFQFFEASSSDITQENLEKSLQLLNSFPNSEKHRLYSIPIDERTPAEKRLIQKLEKAEVSIKIREYINIDENTKQLDSTTLQEIFGEYVEDDGVLMHIDVYLPIFASYVSPDMFAVSQPPTRYNNGVARFTEISTKSAFNDVLLQDDQTSCLSRLLINEFEEILKDILEKEERKNLKDEVTRSGLKNRYLYDQLIECKSKRKIYTPTPYDQDRLSKYYSKYYSMKGKLSPKQMYNIIQTKLKERMESSSPNLDDNSDGEIEL